MENHKVDFEQLSARIDEILLRYVQVDSFTDTVKERDVEKFFKELIQDMSYFSEHPENWGLFAVPGDRLERNVCWAMVSGKGNETVVLVHHYDVVDVEDYKSLKSLAFSPDKLREALLKHKAMLTEDAVKDLEEDTFMFGRGVCDMKGGGAIQYALLEEYGKMALKDNFQGNVIVIGVPDEENLSAGMRAAVRLLANLKRQFDLHYLMMINSEPHQRKDFKVGVFSEGSVGKLMPFIYVRGFLSHAGKVFEGLNPTSVLAEIQCRTEANMDFTDVVECEAAPPPTWLYAKDSKKRYDVSMPLSAFGCFSVLTLKQTPQQLLKKVKQVCQESFETVIKRLNKNYAVFCSETKNSVNCTLPWKATVVSFKELYEEALKNGGQAFLDYWKHNRELALSDIQEGTCNMIEANYRLVDAIYDYIEDISPRVVYGLLPPYYPNVSNLYFEDAATQAKGICKKLQEYTMEQFGQNYSREYFYTGICDLSYTNIDDPILQKSSVAGAMPLFGEYYDIPFDEIKEISMAGLNIGPWGKDFHKLTERVCKEDLYERTPRILDVAIAELLNNK